MAYYDNSLTTVRQLKSSAEKTKTETDALSLAQAVLDARMDAQVTASTDSDEDYVAEVVDGLVDAWANEQASLGANIREGQNRISEAVDQAQELLQRQINALSEAVLGILAIISEKRERQQEE